MLGKILILLVIACLAQLLLVWAVTHLGIVLLGGLGWWLRFWYLGRKDTEPSLSALKHSPPLGPNQG
jgi:hypothetical protein